MMNMLLDRGQHYKASAIWITQIGFVKLILLPKQVINQSVKSKFVHDTKINKNYTTGF